MRYVMVWFTCSTKDCDVKAETLVAMRGDGHSARLSLETLPDGWKRSARTRQAEFKNREDREHTYCPEHAFTTREEYDRLDDRA